MVEYNLNIKKEEIEVMSKISMLVNKKKLYTSELLSLYMLVLLYSLVIDVAYIMDKEGGFFLMLSVMILFSLFVILRSKRAFIMQKIIGAATPKKMRMRTYIFSESGVVVKSAKKESNYTWDKFVTYGEMGQYTYLIMEKAKLILVNHGTLSEDEHVELQRLLQNINIMIEQKQEAEGKRVWLTVLYWTTILFFSLTTCYIGVIQHMPLALGDSFRVWFRWDIPIICVLLMQLFLIIWTITVSIKTKYLSSVLRKVLIWVAGVLMYLLLGVALLATIFQGDWWSEIDNGDGTIIVEEQIWLGEAEYELFQKKNLFVRTYLRDASSYDDIDTSITQEEYESLEQAKEDALYEAYQDAAETSEDEMEAYSQEEPVYAYESAEVQAGYEKIYQEYIETMDTIYQEDYNAKGYTRIVIYEDTTIIKYLVYDGYFENDSYIRYVYYQNVKDEDGSWSPVDAEILNMYYYILETEEVEDTGKTSW